MLQARLSLEVAVHRRYYCSRKQIVSSVEVTFLVYTNPLELSLKMAPAAEKHRVLCKTYIVSQSRVRHATATENPPVNWTTSLEVTLKRHTQVSLDQLRMLVQGLKLLVNCALT